ncbi:MAG TPA: sulfatase-like hydrolase/transferase [Gemmatimonadales bacterium]|jgi:hypothetical protein|nr:sulfatase-like hydrolase/transferase [Gemmatimonadales bacterium]
MRVRATHLYPLLLASFPALHLAAGNPGEYTRRDLATVLLAIGFGVLLLSGLCYGLARLALRRSHPGLTPMLVAVVVGWCFFYLPVDSRLYRMSGGVLPHWLLAGLGLAVTAGILAWLLGRQERLDASGRFLSVLATLLVVFSLMTIVVAQVRSSHRIARSALAEELARPLGANPATAGELRPRPDIYLVLLDMYASSAVLRERYGFDNRRFDDSLRALGFTVPPDVHSNYNQTRHSLPSLLNFAHMSQVGEELGSKSTDASLSYYLLRNNRVARFLQSLGYRFLFFPSSWWPGTHDNPHADVRFDAWAGSGLRGALLQSDLRRHLRSLTPLGLLDLGATDFQHPRRTFEGLKKVAHIPGPTFAFAHVLLPHPPFIVDQDCRPTVRTLPLDSAEAARAYTRQYLDQLICTNRIVLDLVTTLLRTSPSPPVIILQGDHGATSLEPLALVPRKPRSGVEARAEFGAFGAYYLPAGGTRALAGSITLVNLFRDILNYYFGLDIPRQPDSLYYLIGVQYPNRFLRVTPGELEAP